MGQKRHGMDQISVKEGLEAMSLSMESNQSIIAARVQWKAIWRQRQQFGLVQELVDVGSELAVDHNKIAQFSGSSPSTRMQQLCTYIINLLANDTGEDASVYQTALDKDFDRLGLKSMSMES